MANYFMKLKIVFPLLILFLSLQSFFCIAQIGADSSLTKPLNGLSFKQDSLLLVNLHFRIQSRFGFISQNLQNVFPGNFDIGIRRARLIFDGHVYSKKLTYLLQINFSKRDLDEDNTGVNHILRDAMIWYEAWKGMKIGLGQGKLPGNRQRIISSGTLEFTDRSIANNAYNLDRDAGFFAYQSLMIGKIGVNFKTALTSGEGRNAGISDKGLATTGRIEILPFGNFTGNNDMTEADIEVEKKPKLCIAAVAHYNDLAKKTMGQTGAILPTQRYLHAYMADVLFKYYGFAFSSEYLYRGVNNPFMNFNKQGYFIAGDGLNTQMSYCFENNTNIAFRYAITRPDSLLANLIPHQKQYGMCVSKFINHHKIKIQAEIQFNEESYRKNGKLINQNIRQYIAGFLQIELGI
jgi:phosphate-selective porin OprO/OprP